jgi:aspartate/methionine/tyrosine aminotransferase
MTQPTLVREWSGLDAFREVPHTGVVYVTREATRRGFSPHDPSWWNLGQGSPETGPLPGGAPRVDGIPIAPDDHEYSPVAGVMELREAVAELYNRLYRRGMGSRYTAENVAIASGGRSVLTRAVASLGNINLGHFLPDYTAYEELLDAFRHATEIPILLARRRGYRIPVDDLRREVAGRGLGGILLSNPGNPSGHVLSGDDLAGWVGSARELSCAMVFDEFYSHYVWKRDPTEPGPTVSAARYVEDVDRDPVVILDGLTKNWRYPGWRVGWIVGPKAIIERVESAGSFLDGGSPRPLQRAAVPLLEPDRVLAEAAALQQAFRPKRDLMVRRLREMGLRFDREPEGAFYAFASLEDLPDELSDGMAFFRRCLEHKVVVVPGVFFDVNPGQRRNPRACRFTGYVRFSFGPPEDRVRGGLDQLERVIRGAAVTVA